jgi:toxin-antitoxin system PIN domain toxin
VSFALDVNLLLYSSDRASPYHERARRFLDSCLEADEVFYLGWPTIMSYLRVATHPAIFAEPLAPEEAMANVELLIEHPYVRFLAEGDDFWDTYRALTGEVPTRGNLVPDAHLTALLRSHGVKTLYTRDRDFLKFAVLDVRDPLA